ncbi:GerAB/ArcD/ProY family transporter [Halobacillus sp. A5]|uniref:GerAB/ArcD/ProY family transporter n=1 Tax=Halobacillus sp. A5 TaxID=2880263 RepID=UPI0020A6238F|nr:GerAB/ArcD/ProY family transporter [Halobacillus sp. A5]MCP3026827.1 spore germination protein [Halobacillus sp. A5]
MNKISGKQGVQIPEQFLVTPMFVFFIIHSMQVGVGILGFEGYIAEHSGFDSWISIIMAGVFIHLLLWMLYNILRDSGGDIVSIHRDVFGKYIGGFFSLILSIYFLLLALTVLRTFLEVIQVWIFPSIRIEFFTLVFLMLIYYLVIGGFRLVTGFCMISVILTLPLLLLKFFPIDVGSVNYLYPAIEHSLTDLLKSAKATILSFLGIELLFVFYPFIKHPQRSVKWAHFGVFFTVLIYLATALVAFIYYSEEQLEHVTWGTISLWKIVEFPFIERFEYIGIALWVYVIVPNICLAMWGASRIPKRLFNANQKLMIVVYCAILYILTLFLDDREIVEKINTFTSQVGFYVLLYIPLLFVITKVFYKVRNQHES